MTIPINSRGVTTHTIWLDDISISAGTHLGVHFYRMMLERQAQYEQEQAQQSTFHFSSVQNQRIEDKIS